VALQFLGNLFQFFLVRRNKGKQGRNREHLTVVGATSGDTGSAAIYGLRGKKDVSVFIMFPDGKVSPVQEAQMTTVLDANVHNVAVEGTFDDCQVREFPIRKFVLMFFAGHRIKSLQKMKRGYRRNSLTPTQFSYLEWASPIMDANWHQDFVKALFADPEMNKSHRLAAVNSINW
jgi:threonine synthase